LSGQHAIAFEHFRDRGKDTISNGTKALMKACSDIRDAPWRSPGDALVEPDLLLWRDGRELDRRLSGGWPDGPF
jgi:hypothetical protein